VSTSLKLTLVSTKIKMSLRRSILKTAPKIPTTMMISMIRLLALRRPKSNPNPNVSAAQEKKRKQEPRR
jgi:hypothetical protein